MNAEDIRKLSNAAGNVAKIATAYPWGTMVVIALATTVLICRVTLPLLKSCNEKYDALVTELLEKNNIIRSKEQVIHSQQDTIRAQRVVMQEADSTISKAAKFNYETIKNDKR